MDTYTLTNYVIKDNEVTYTRTFNAASNLVWEAWSKVELLENWFGPFGFSITTQHFAFEENGSWKFIMHGPDGTDFPNHIKFLKIVPIQMIEYKHVDDEDREAISFSVTVSFESKGESTILTMKHVFKTIEQLQYVAEHYGAIEGGQQTLARLATLVEK
ncbi:MAG: SRPBCC domain-containing protein [Crocinitomicaceae bacterium]|nr:SRPBCC domain-containing protein [Crocinitomicaceae bacterium]